MFTQIIETIARPLFARERARRAARYAEGIARAEAIRSTVRRPAPGFYTRTR